LFCAWTLATGWQIYRVCRQLVVGLDFLVVSLAVFALALGVSLAKAGVLARWYGTWRRRLPDPTD
jgi:peptidoglycan/LPS O-acetylase OafA/YrhL